MVTLPHDHDKKTIIVYGGRSGEHEVSLRSAASVIRHLRTPSNRLCLIAIDKDGNWILQTQSLIEEVRQGAELKIQGGKAILLIPGQGFVYQEKDQLISIACEVVFPVLHGSFGEDGTIQGLLELLELPYVGSGVLGSSLGMDKEKVKRVWMQAGLPVVPFRSLEKSLFDAKQSHQLWQQILTIYTVPVFVKPSRGGSSVGISRVLNEAEFLPALELAFKFDNKVLIEPGIDAREIEVAVLGNDTLQAFLPGEIVPQHEYYDYDAKYLDPDGARFQIPAAIDQDQIDLVRDIAIKAYQLCEARGLSRVDFFLDKKTGQLLLNEINTMPGFTNVSMYPMMCQASGLSYSDLLDTLLDLGKKEFIQKNSLAYSNT